jgi:hypothetical protein
MKVSVASELDAFAQSVQQLVNATATDDAWQPGTHVDDRSERLSAGLVGLGWDDLSAGDEDTLPFLAASALELGRAAASPYDIMQLLGGSPMVNGLAMYAQPGQQVAIADETGYCTATVTSSTPVKFADSLGVHCVTAFEGTHSMLDAAQRAAAWETATIGYLAGLASYVVDLALEYAHGREIFGRTLAHLDAIQQRLGDAATNVEMLVLSAREGAHGLPALAHATSSTWNVISQGHLVFGAVGFTLEFPMQRYSRRAKALGAFADGWIDQRIGYAA